MWMSRICKFLQTGSAFELVRRWKESLAVLLNDHSLLYKRGCFKKGILASGSFFLSFLFKLINYFKTSFVVTTKLSRKYRIFRIIVYPHMCTASSTFDILLQSGTCIKASKPTLTYHFHPKSVRVLSW